MFNTTLLYSSTNLEKICFYLRFVASGSDLVRYYYCCLFGRQLDNGVHQLSKRLIVKKFNLQSIASNIKKAGTTVLTNLHVHGFCKFHKIHAFKALLKNQGLS